MVKDVRILLSLFSTIWAEKNSLERGKTNLEVDPGSATKCISNSKAGLEIRLGLKGPGSILRLDMHSITSSNYL